MILKLPDEHQLFLQYLFPLLHHISRNEEVNCMNTINLAICFSPSLLWPDSGLDVIKNEVPPLVQFMVEHSPKIFGSELPELYKQVAMPSTEGVEQMEFTLQSAEVSSSSLVPTKVEDGSVGSHKRSESLDSSMSEDSLYDNKSSLVRTRKSGLTLSDSQLSTISQHEYVLPTHHNARDYIAKHVGVLPHQRDFVAPMPKRVKKVREPKRSSSLRGPNDMPPSSRHHYQRKQRDVEPNSRRKSFAVQPMSIKKNEYVPGFQPIPDSPNASISSSSQDYLPQFVHVPHSHRVPSSTTYTDKNGYREAYHPYAFNRHDDATRQPVQKKRCLPQHSHSFSKGSDNKPAKLMATSSSFYDRLLPLEPEAKAKSRSMATSIGSRHPLSDNNREHDRLEWRVGSGPIFEGHGKTNGESHSARQPLALSMKQQMPSNQSLASSRSGSSASGHQRPQSRPSNMSLASSGSAGSQRSPDLTQLEHTPLNQMDGEFFKVAISKRFGLTDSQDTASPQHHSTQTPVTTTPYYSAVKEQSDRKQTAMYDKLENYHAPTESIDQSQRKTRVDSITSDSSFSKSHSYQSFLSSQQKKDSLVSLTEESGLDDRPESDQHLHSLPRPHTAEFVRPEKMSSVVHANYPPMVIPPQMLPVGAVIEVVPDHDSNKLYPSSGYNSDTESSPSRTLSRPGKIQEVMSPTKLSMVPSRYQTHNPNDGSRHVRAQYSRQLPSQRLKQQAFRRQGGLSLDEVGIRKNQQLTSDSLPGASQYTPPSFEEYPQLSLEEAASAFVAQETTNEESKMNVATVTLTADSNIQDKSTALTNQRPKSGDSSKIGRFVGTYGTGVQSKPENPVVEDAKVRLGLIPRTRSKSTSEKEAMRIIHKIVEEDETAARTAEEEERAEKHKVWLQSAPTSAERRKAWEALSQANFQRQDARSRSLRNEGTPNGAANKVVLIPSLTPEMKRRSATMPEYLTTGSRRVRGIMAQVRTVKVVSYDIPKPERIRRINLRTAYH